jgi:hypothetical protein
VIRWSYAFVDRPAAAFPAACAFWSTVTRTTVSPPRGRHGEFVTLLPDAGDACLKAQAVGDAGGAHVDLSVEDVPASVARAGRLGATTVAGHGSFAVLRSPGGMVFCVVPALGEATRPAVVDHPTGGRSRVDQVCLDIPPRVYADEVAFWRELTAWEFHRGALPEFDLLKPPATLPLRLLLQRLDTDRAASSHLDLACSDVDATRSWHEACGAEVVQRRPLWTVMRDPAGGVYCLTTRDPHTGRLPEWALAKVDP